MSYYIYLDKMLLPVPPGEITLTIGNQNETMNLINEGEVNLLKSPGLTEVEFEALLPQVPYPFAFYKNGFKRATYFTNKLKELKVKKDPFQFIVTRSMPDGKLLFDTNLKVSLEEYTIKESSDEGMDLLVDIRLKQYREFGTKTAKIKFAPASKPNTKPKIQTKKARSTEKSPAPKKKAKTYTVKRGDCLWNIAKRFYGNGSKYPKIYNANRGKIKNPNLIYPGQKLTIPV